MVRIVALFVLAMWVVYFAMAAFIPIELSCIGEICASHPPAFFGVLALLLGIATYLLFALYQHDGDTPMFASALYASVMAGGLAAGAYFLTGSLYVFTYGVFTVPWQVAYPAFALYYAAAGGIAASAVLAAFERRKIEAALHPTAVAEAAGEAVEEIIAAPVEKPVAKIVKIAKRREEDEVVL